MEMFVKFFDRKLVVPKTWSASSNIIRWKNPDNGSGIGADDDGRSYLENSNVSESLLLMKFYSLSSGMVNHLLTDCDGREIDLPFEVQMNN